jgi:predicted enzyme related to lactoylglutathione lyase
MRYIHTNLIARDWQRLADFYIEVFGCTVRSTRDLAGSWLERASGVPGARIRGAHLSLPGFGADGPTLEIFQYDESVDASLPVANRVGFGHIAFEVDDVAKARDRVAGKGGFAMGSIETVTIAGGGTITWTYVRDPEGNIVELQHRGE